MGQQAARPRLLLVGDDFMPVSVFQLAFSALQEQADISYLQLRPNAAYQPSTDSELRIREYLGDPLQLIEALDGHTGLIVHGAPVTAEIIQAAPYLSLIGCARGGPVNVDVEAATTRGISVISTPGKNALAVAELTLALMLCLARHMPDAMEALRRSGSAGHSTFEGSPYMGRELSRQALGLIGLGNVGRLVAERALTLGMTVLAFDPYLTDPADVPGVLLTSLDEVLARADFVSLHARARPDNVHMIGATQLRAMKPSAYLINTARESLVDEDALLQALDAGWIAGAGLDVVEPAEGPHPLVGRGDVIVTPHIAGATTETLERGARMLAEDVARILAGNTPLHRVNEVPAQRLVAP